jgi:hypothetical protein
VSRGNTSPLGEAASAKFQVSSVKPSFDLHFCSKFRRLCFQLYEKSSQLERIGDSFRKIMVVNDPLQLPSFDDSGIAYVGLLDFLLDPDLL